MKGELNIFEFTEKFPTEESCIRFLVKSRWSDGKVISPFSGGESFAINTRPGLYKCKKTRKQFSVRKGTIFEESRLSLKKWFFAIFIMHSLKKGISSVQMAKYLGVTQKTAWFMLHRIRYAINHKSFSAPLNGVVEIDEHYSGGRKKGGKRGRGAENKTPVVGMVERGGQIRCKSVEDTKSATLIPIVRQNVSLKAQIVTDEYPSYNQLDRDGYSRSVVHHGEKEYVRGSVHTNTIEGFWSHLKQGIKAIQIHVSKKHLDKYCSEYEFKYNSRKISDYERFNSWFSMCFGRLTYQQLKSK